MTLDFSQHPCFNESAKHKFARIHLPVAVGCNVQCNFCNRRYNCVNESRPGVTSVTLEPEQALNYLDQALAKSPNIKVVGIAGPGDPFANAHETMETLRLVRSKYPDILLCVATNGLELEPHVEELAKLQISHVTVTVNAVDPTIGEKIYAWVRYNQRNYRGRDAAALLWERQQSAIKKLKSHGITVKANCVVIKEVNESHVSDVASTLAAMGVDVLNPMALYPAPGAVFDKTYSPESTAMEELRAELKNILPLMSHCTRCRADAVGLLGQDNSSFLSLLRESAIVKSDPTRVRVAVASIEGILVNEHLGKARRFLVYEIKDGKLSLVEERKAPPEGGGDKRWSDVANILGDCFALLTGEVGPNPTKMLSGYGIKVYSVEGMIEQLVPLVFSGNDLKKYTRRSFSCKGSCGGNRMGCG